MRSRLPWLFVNLFTAAAAASVVYVFQETIERAVILAAIMPVIAGMGGNAGTQALAVTVRRLALTEESAARRWGVVAKELMVGLVNGAALGIFVGLVSYLWVGDPDLGFVVLLAMWGNMILASIAGAFVPDPARAPGCGPGRRVLDLRHHVHRRRRLLPPARPRLRPATMKRWRRALTIIARLTPFLVAFLRDRRRWILLGRRRRLPYERHERRAERLVATIAALGPTFIKLAQVFSARADILPEPYLSAIGRLQDRVPPHPTEEIEAVITAELGQPVDAVFAEFDRVPVAAASLGQVHRARLRPQLDEPGPEVAVKVLRPGVEELVAVDLEISFRVLFLLNILFPNHHVRALTNVVREFSVKVREEMDFREEAAHMALFHQNFARDARVRAPRVYTELARRRVLVMEWVQGDKLDRLAGRFASGELDFERVMETLTEVYLRMLLVDGFVHADPHAGNILVTEAGTIIFLDWGMVVQLSRSTRESILRLALAAGRRTSTA